MARQTWFLLVLQMQRDGHPTDEIQGQWLIQRKGQIALPTTIRREFTQERGVTGDRRINADVP